MRARSLLAVSLLASSSRIAAGQSGVPARVVIDATRVEAQISPMLYGQFAEMMFGGVKRGIQSELLLDRGFEESPNAIGLPRYWERYLGLLRNPLARLVDLLVIKQGERIAHQKGWKLPRRAPAAEAKPKRAGRKARRRAGAPSAASQPSLFE